jgi:hypothetical protein
MSFPCDGFLEDGVGAVEVTGQNARDSLHGPGHRHHDARRCILLRGLVSVGAHLLNPAAAQDGPVRGGRRLGERVAGLVRVPGLPAVDHIDPPLGLGWPPDRPGELGGVRGGQRVPLDPAPVLQPPEPPLQGGDPGLPVERQPEFFHHPGCGIDVPGSHEVLQRLRRQVIAQAPAGSSPPQHRDHARLQPLELGQQHIAEQVVVAVPLPPPIQRYQQQVRPGQLGQGRGRPGSSQHRLDQRPGHALQHRGLGQERALPRRDAGQELRLHVLAHQSVIARERDRCGAQRASRPQGQRRQVQPDRPSLGSLVQLGHLVLAERYLRGGQQRGRLREGQA